MGALLLAFALGVCVEVFFTMLLADFAIRTDKRQRREAREFWERTKRNEQEGSEQAPPRLP